MGIESSDSTNESKFEMHINLQEWSQDKEVFAACEKLAEREGLNKETFGKATWTFLTFVLGTRLIL